ncbi:hypothetical protein [Streptomyces sp. SJL17-1]|uniref:hypothetical protein n=1 Tax=Streptomyces sp. SJL17-1 TaxID=2967223 RepID=UPI002966F0A9|nr:hypothetical protein [Streptomyces sp. SJL17-1]
MARTAHHIPRSRRSFPVDRPVGDPWCSLVLYDLRLSTACLTEAVRECGRPRPQAIRRTVSVHRWPRFSQDRTVARWSEKEERTARTRLRTQAGLLLRLVNSPDGTLDMRAADAVDIEPARHRRSGLWCA